MKRRINVWSNIDWLTVILYVLLVFLGWINIYSAVYNEEHQSILDFSQRYGKQLIWISAAFVIAILIMIIDSNFYSFFAYFLHFVVLLLLVVVTLFGTEIHGSRAWLEFGNVRFQPAEFAKITTALALARYLSSHNITLNRMKTYLRLALIILVPMAIILLQNDTGSALVFTAFILVLYRQGLSLGVLLFGVYVIALFIFTLILGKLFVIFGTIGLALIVLWILNKRFKYVWVAAGILLISGGLFYGINYVFQLNVSMYYVILGALVFSSIFYIILAYWHKVSRVMLLLVLLFGSIGVAYSVDHVFNNFLESHQQKRINQLLGLESDPLGAGYNINQSKIAIGSGRLTGKGFLNGTQTKFDFVPEQSTDFIFCTIGEEWGFIGSFVLISLFIMLLLRLLFLAERQRSAFSRIYGYGVISVLFFHFVINIGMTIGLVPVIGIPLPFISYGGSSLWAFTILLFVFIRLDVSRLKVLQ
ncbi:MAG: rod shape-determining protein RodA [Bacteroidales bacterium]|nr:rod shape-determining protein RodA [Bacteroidales bacterium]